MIVQILCEYGKRTEYKVLEKFATIEEVSINNISKGILLLPGILLDKLERAEINVLKKWLNISDNQLILSPAWKEVCLNDYFDISLNLMVLKDECLEFEEIKCQYKIESKVQEKIFSNEQGNFGVHYRKDTGSGLLTIITLPLLDYKLSHLHDKLFQYFSNCISEKQMKENDDKKVNQNIDEIGNNYLQLFMLLMAGFQKEDLQEGLRLYFNKNIDREHIEDIVKDLKQKDIIKGERVEITEKGKTLIMEKRLKSFIKLLERRKVSNEW